MIRDCNKIVIIGGPNAGKTTLAKDLSSILNILYFFTRKMDYRRQSFSKFRIDFRAKSPKSKKYKSYFLNKTLLYNIRKT